jgi:putative transposase
LVYHALNRGVAQLPLFQKDEDYRAFERVLALAQAKHPCRLLGYCLMPNHWHMVLWPAKDGQMTAMLRWLTHTHTMRCHAHYHTEGTGHLYQGRFKAFPIQADDHLYAVLRYVERNALRARLVKRAENWRWSSLWRRQQGSTEDQAILAKWPVPEPSNWLELVNEAQTEAELLALRLSVNRGRPFGSTAWAQRTVKRLGLEATINPRGRPRKKKTQAKPKSETK